MKKLITFVLFTLFFGASSLGASISISPESGHFGKNCVMEFDIIVESLSDNILTVDVYLESSMEYVDFVPSNIFKYYLPPIIEGNKIYLWAFSESWVKFVWKEKFGTLYLKSDDVSLDWYVNFDFRWQGNTTDTNLNLIWWIDVLDEVKNWTYYFDLDPCEQNIVDDVVSDIEWWFSSIDEEQYVQDMISEFNKRWVAQKVSLFFSKYWRSFALFVLVLAFIYVFIKNKKSLSKWKKLKK
jgi:hypothetical protein